MSNKDHEGLSATARRLIAIGVTGLLSVALAVAVLIIREDDTEQPAPTATPSSSRTATPTTASAVDTRAEIVNRLKEILRIRDRAFRERDAKILEDVYTVDCPCLAGDRNAIRELQTHDYQVVGGETSIRVHRLEQVNKRLWLVVADFSSAPLRIEGRDKKLIREEPAGSDLFQFALSKPTDSDEWLLGQATVYRDG